MKKFTGIITMFVLTFILASPAMAADIGSADVYGNRWTYNHYGVRCPVTIMEDGRVTYLDSEHNMVYHFNDRNSMVLGAITETRNGLDLYADWDGNLFTDEDGVRCFVTEAKNGDLSYVAPDGELVIAKPNRNIIRDSLINRNT